MTDKKTFKETMIGTSGSILSGVSVAAGACCAGPGAAACGAVCAPACGSALTSVFGLSTSAFAAWASNLLPLFMVISAIAFTSSYYKLFKAPKSDCAPAPKSYSKPIFWLSLILTTGLYGYAFTAQNNGFFPMNESPQASLGYCTPDSTLTNIEGDSLLISTTAATACCSSRKPTSSCNKASTSSTCCSTKTPQKAIQNTGDASSKSVACCSSKQQKACGNKAPK